MGFRAEEKVDRRLQNKRPPGTFVAGRPFVSFPSHDCSLLEAKTLLRVTPTSNAAQNVIQTPLRQ